MENLAIAWFPDQDIIRLVPDLTDFPFGPENVIVKVATPEMALNPMYVLMQSLQLDQQARLQISPTHGLCRRARTFQRTLSCIPALCLALTR